MGRWIYGGIYDPGSPLADAHGYRTDVLEALRELEIPVIRYPGGNFIASCSIEVIVLVTSHPRSVLADFESELISTHTNYQSTSRRWPGIL